MNSEEISEFCFQEFTPEFYYRQGELVIEVDGDVHDLQKEEDERREKVLSEMGLKIVRFGNDAVVRDLSMVVGRIEELLENSSNIIPQ